MRNEWRAEHLLTLLIAAYGLVTLSLILTIGFFVWEIWQGNLMLLLLLPGLALPTGGLLLIAHLLYKHRARMKQVRNLICNVRYLCHEYRRGALQNTYFRKLFEYLHTPPEHFRPLVRSWPYY